MSRTRTSIAIALVLVLTVVASPRAEAAATADQVAAGAKLVHVGGCNDCHTPWVMGPGGPAPDMTRMLSGHPESLILPPPPALAPDAPWNAAAAASFTGWSGPWGVSFTANLTPDPETGLGKWTEAEFVGTLQTGRHQGRGRQILPPMPWQNLSTLPVEDLKAIYAYLRTIPPIRNKVPDPIPPAPAPAH